MARLVALTGATGFIGQRLCAHLLGRGDSVRALLRSPQKASRLPDSIETVTGSLQTPDALQQLLSGADAVIHLAGVVRGNKAEDFLVSNCEGTRAVLTAAGSVAPGARIIHVSSLAAREPQLSWYSRSKRAGEELVKASSLDWVVLRPPAIYGPGDEEMRAIFDWMARGIALVPGSIEARTSLLHVDDLVQAIATCLDGEAAAGQVFELGDEKSGGYNWREMATIAGTVYGREVRLWQVPAPLLNAVAALSLGLGRLTGKPAMLTPPKLRELRFDNWVTDNRAISEATGWSPQIGLHDGLLTLDNTAL
ncbi:MAG: SDR family NAD(P)-dependent oxidoreductase [Halieaceae bacterium]|nr:SDR family NAD(P)-dependent oxidoreductase [Halieaceae bacterium]